MEIEYLLRCEPEPELPFDGGDGSAADGQWIADQLASGNEWAWCCVFITARVEIAGETFEGTSSMGGCSYKSESDFRDDPYFADLKAEARDQLFEALHEVGARGQLAIRVLQALEVKS